MAVLITIIGFGIMIFLHELGHCVTAKAFGVWVHEFAIGMGPKLISWGKGETKYSLRALPLGGFVRLEGEDAESDSPRAFHNIHPLKKIVVLCSGALMNLLLGFVLFAVINTSFPAVTATVGETIDGMGAQAAGISGGDVIVRIDNQRVHMKKDADLIILRQKKESFAVEYLRGGERRTVQVKTTEEDGRSFLGIRFKEAEPGFFTALTYSFYDTVYIVKVVFVSLSGLIHREYGLDALSGPVGIVAVVGEVTAQPDKYMMLNILSLFAMITVNLGVFNLLPLPALDGGSVIFALLELISRRRLNQNILGYINLVGFALLMVLAAVVMVGDFRKIIGGW